VAELEAERTDLERQILRSLAYLRSDQRSGRARVAAATTAVAANEVALGAIEEQFTVGRRTILQVLDARRDLSDVKQALALARRDAALSGYAALALTGDVLDVLGILLPVRAEMSGLAQ
jgi:outer membrane protein TolC